MEKISIANPTVTKEKQENEVSTSSEKLKATEFITEKGSVYKYLPDGRTQRHKTATGEDNDIQDICVFIPPYEKISAEAKRIYSHIFEKIETTLQFEQFILPYAQSEGYTIRVIGDNNTELTNVSDMANTHRVFIALINKKSPEKSLTLPVSKVPKVGYNTFDTRKYIAENGETMRERHIGNKVIEIKY